MKKFVNITNKEKGNIFSKKAFEKYQLTEKGRNWIEGELFMHYLPKNATIGTFIKTIISKINHLKQYNNNIYRSPF